MKNKKRLQKKEISLKSNIVFCAECGEELETFGISGEKINIKKIKERHKRCKDTGKFKGDKCAMIFIAEESERLLTFDEDE